VGVHHGGARPRTAGAGDLTAGGSAGATGPFVKFAGRDHRRTSAPDQGAPHSPAAARMRRCANAFAEAFRETARRS
jgi:hypothetical protein